MKGAGALLVIGGARSGKSAYAQAHVERRCAGATLTPVFIATAQAYDAEMEDRIAGHVAARGAAWHTVEAPYDLAATMMRESAAGRLLLVDCLTLWLSNVTLRGDAIEPAAAELVEAIARLPGPAVLVSNEVGAGIVPDNALARRFRDAQGRLNQTLAQACAEVVLVVAGLPLVLKTTAPIC